MVTKAQIDSFYSFASHQITNGGASLSIDDLYELWRVENPLPEELAESVSSVNAALADMEAGDTGMAVDEHLARLRSKYQLSE